MVTQEKARRAQLFLVGLTSDNSDSSPGAWAFATKYPAKQQIVSGAIPKFTSPGRMYVMALLNGLQQLLDGANEIEIVSDDAYIEKIIHRKKQFFSNNDLIKLIDEIVERNHLNLRVTTVPPKLVEGDSYFHELGFLRSQARKQNHRAEHLNTKYNYQKDGRGRNIPQNTEL